MARRWPSPQPPPASGYPARRAGRGAYCRVRGGISGIPPPVSQCVGRGGTTRPHGCSKPLTGFRKSHNVDSQGPAPGFPQTGAGPFPFRLGLKSSRSGAAFVGINPFSQCFRVKRGTLNYVIRGSLGSECRRSRRRWHERRSHRTNRDIDCSATIYGRVQCPTRYSILTNSVSGRR